MTSETTTAYDPLLRRIHWLTAVLFITGMLIGFYCGLQQPGTSPRRELLEVHKSLGVNLATPSAQGLRAAREAVPGLLL